MRLTGSNDTGEGQRCPFCGSPWTAAMLDALDASSVAGCACCSGTPGGRHASMPPATRDICCATCGRPIYRALAAHAPHQETAS